jgi:hypothetical protein
MSKLESEMKQMFQLKVAEKEAKMRQNEEEVDYCFFGVDDSCMQSIKSCVILLHVNAPNSKKRSVVLKVRFVGVAGDVR